MNLDQLNDIHIDVLKEIGNIGSGNAATALASILGDTVAMDVPKVNIVDVNQAVAALGGPENISICVLSKLEGESPYQDETDYFRDIDNVYELLPIDVIEMNFGYSVIPLVDQGCGSNFVERLVMFRKQFALGLGIGDVVPDTVQCLSLIHI